MHCRIVKPEALPEHVFEVDAETEGKEEVPDFGLNNPRGCTISTDPQHQSPPPTAIPANPSPRTTYPALGYNVGGSNKQLSD